MNILKVLEELHQERARLMAAIDILERLAAGRGKRRGRPPVWMAALNKTGKPPDAKSKPKVEE